jgi:succinate dehydrogenase hydrophobic anchor subunit
VILKHVASTPSKVRELHHMTAYFLVGGIPAALLLGEPVSPIFDAVFAVFIPLHFHIGMRSIIIE